MDGDRGTTRRESVGAPRPAAHRCGNCGAENDPAAIVCAACDALLAAYDPPPGSHPSDPVPPAAASPPLDRPSLDEAARPAVPLDAVEPEPEALVVRSPLDAATAPPEPSPVEEPSAGEDRLPDRPETIAPEDVVPSPEPPPSPPSAGSKPTSVTEVSVAERETSVGADPRVRPAPGVPPAPGVRPRRPRPAPPTDGATLDQDGKPAASAPAPAVAARPRRAALADAPDPTIPLPTRQPGKPGRLARTSPEAMLLVGAILSLASCALIALAEMAAGVGIAGLALGAVALYVVAVGLIQAVLRRGGRLF